MIRTGMAAAVLGLFIAGCGDAAPEMSAEERAAAEAAIDEARARFERTVASGDWTALGALLAEGAVMVQPGSDDWRRMQALAGGAPFADGAKISITPIDVTVIDAEWAVEFGASTVTYPGPDGTDEALRDTYLILLRNTGDGWKPYREVASASPPPGGWPD